MIEFFLTDDLNNPTARIKAIIIKVKHMMIKRACARKDTGQLQD